MYRIRLTLRFGSSLQGSDLYRCPAERGEPLPGAAPSANHFPGAVRGRPAYPHPLVHAAAFDQIISIRGKPSLESALLNQLSESGFGADRGFFTFSIRLPETDIVCKLISAVVRIIFEKYVREGYGAQRIATYLNSLGYRARTGKMWHHASIRGYHFAEPEGVIFVLPFVPDTGC